ncbi:MAG: hypothetical protein KDD70_01845 [Bdellovibrionales bacterium]|nr:hypothetical protein [Bdellovibrionales bacterium]
MKSLLRLYEVVTTCIAPFVGLLFLLHPRGRSRWLERFGVWRLPKGKYVWIHGASAGELNGLLRLVPWIRKQYPDCKVLITSFSIAGVSLAKAIGDEVRLIPYDSPVYRRIALGSSHIRLFLFGETEIWPSLIASLQEASVPCCLVNGRIEEKSYALYSRFGPFFRPILEWLSVAIVTSQESQHRIEALGVPKERTFLTGNTKYDCLPKVTELESRSLRRLLLGEEGRRVVTLGSAHPGEEEWWIEALRQVKDDVKPLLIIAPRHLEKLQLFRSALDRSALSYSLLSEIPEGTRVSSQVLIVDSFGVLEQYYALADLAFIGGTLVPVGGHNPFEPAPYRVPICLGPHTHRIQTEVALLRESEAVLPIREKQEVIELLHKLQKHDAVLQSRAERLFQLWQGFRGATEEVEQILHRALFPFEEMANSRSAL